MQTYIQSTIAVLSVINPIVTSAMLMQVTAGFSVRQQMKAATKVWLTILTILLVAATGGRYILHAFGISLDVFQIVGGVIISYIGFRMLGGQIDSGEESERQAGDLTPLIMFAASPGTIATVVTLSAVHSPRGVPVIAIVAVGISTFVTWGSMLLIALLSGRFQTGQQKLATRFMGLIISAMGLQFVLEGYKAFMTGG